MEILARLATEGDQVDDTGAVTLRFQAGTFADTQAGVEQEQDTEAVAPAACSR